MTTKQPTLLALCGSLRKGSEKVAVLMGASTGGFGAARGLNHLRQVMQALGVWVAPTLLTVSQAASAFDAQGRLVGPRTRDNLEHLVRAGLRHG